MFSNDKHTNRPYFQRMTWLEFIEQVSLHRVDISGNKTTSKYISFSKR